MSFTAEDIQTKQFNVRFRGFDIEEVDAFLEQVAENYMLLAHEKKELSDELNKLKMDMKDFESREKTFHHAILSTQKIADEIEAKSRREAEERLAQAEEEVQRLQEGANAEIVALERQLDELKDARKNIQGELKVYLMSCLDALGRDDVSLPSLGQSVMKGEEPAEAADDDLEDLYEKIELQAEMNLSGIGGESEEVSFGMADEDTEDHAEDLEGEEESSLLPDLDGDMMFSMNDPVDREHEPAVVIGKLEGDDRKNGF